jgi:hypothetical protein
MADSDRSRGWWRAVAGAALLAVSAVIAPTASAQNTGLQLSSDAVEPVDLNSAPEVAPVARPTGLAINRPTIPMADYAAAKNAAAARAPGQAKPGAAPPSTTGVTLFAQVASTNQTQSCCFPPDGDIATSATWMVQVNNDVITTLNWNTNAFAQRKLSTFFGDGSNFIFDPRVIYDRYWNRFVVLADGCTNCNTATNASVFELAISQTGDPTGGWFIYRFGPGTATGDFADFPQMGMDLNSIIMTYNDFFLAGGLEARTAAISKAYLYNGLGFSVPVFGGGSCTIAPPYVIDNSGVDYVMQFCPGATSVAIGSMRDTGLSTVSLNLVDTAVAVTNNGIPPNAPQPGISYDLDTGDNRFENRSLQVGSRLLNAATINLVGFPAPSWYNFDVSVTPHTEVSEGVYFASNTSYDWHPAITANTVAAPAGTPLGEIFTTWMSTDPFNNINVQLRADGGIGDDPAFGSGIPVFTSSIPLTNQTDSLGRHRTGDYSYIALYPAAALGCVANEVGVLEGETSGPAAGTWGTHVGIVKHC